MEFPPFFGGPYTAETQTGNVELRPNSIDVENMS